MEIDAVIDNLIRRRLTPTDGEFADAENRAIRIGSFLERDPQMEVAFFEVGGSCGKKTATRPLGDADLFVYLQPESWVTRAGTENKPSTVLGAFKRRIEHAYRSHINEGRVRVRVQNHSVGLIPQGAKSAAVDIVPVRWDGNRDLLGEIPDRGAAEWRPTCVRRQMELLDTLDVVGLPVRRAIRLLKVWRRVHQLDLRSYALEILVLHAAYNATARHPRTLAMSVLETIHNTQLRAPIVIPKYAQPRRYRRAAVHIYDPAVAENNVGDNIAADERDRIVSRARRTWNSLMRAEEAMQRSREGDAAEHLTKAFGIRFEAR